MRGTSSKNQEEANKQLGQNYTLNTTTQCEQKPQQLHPVLPHGNRHGGLSPQVHHNGAEMTGGTESGEQHCDKGEG